MKKFKDIRPVDEAMYSTGIKIDRSKVKLNKAFNKLAKSVVDMRKDIDDLAKADEDKDIHDQIISMEKSLDAIWKTATKASKIV
jgi:phosphate uptake regulator